VLVTYPYLNLYQEKESKNLGSSLLRHKGPNAIIPRVEKLLSFNHSVIFSTVSSGVLVFIVTFLPSVSSSGISVIASPSTIATLHVVPLTKNLNHEQNSINYPVSMPAYLSSIFNQIDILNLNKRIDFLIFKKIKIFKESFGILVDSKTGHSNHIED
jgi:hypothetical protein